MLLVGPDRVEYPLEHWNRDTFLYASSPDLPDALSSVRFTIGADGTADGVGHRHLRRQWAGGLRARAGAVAA